MCSDFEKITKAAKDIMLARCSYGMEAREAVLDIFDFALPFVTALQDIGFALRENIDCKTILKCKLFMLCDEYGIRMTNDLNDNRKGLLFYLDQEELKIVLIVDGNKHMF